MSPTTVPPLASHSAAVINGREPVSSSGGFSMAGESAVAGSLFSGPEQAKERVNDPRIRSSVAMRIRGDYTVGPAIDLWPRSWTPSGGCPRQTRVSSTSGNSATRKLLRRAVRTRSSRGLVVKFRFSERRRARTVRFRLMCLKRGEDGWPQRCARLPRSVGLRL